MTNYDPSDPRHERWHVPPGNQQPPNPGFPNQPSGSPSQSQPSWQNPPAPQTPPGWAGQQNPPSWQNQPGWQQQPQQQPSWASGPPNAYPQNQAYPYGPGQPYPPGQPGYNPSGNQYYGPNNLPQPPAPHRGKKKMGLFLSALALVFVLIITGGFFLLKSSGGIGGLMVSGSEYGKDLGTIEANGVLPYKVGFDEYNAEYNGEQTLKMEWLRVYMDKDLTTLAPQAKVETSGGGDLTVSPTNPYPQSCLDKGKGTAVTPVDNPTLNRWTQEQYWVAMYLNPKTGKQLDKPLVSTFHVKPSSLSAPKASVAIDASGHPVFSWEPVPGATKYTVMTMGQKGSNADLASMFPCKDVLGQTAESSLTYTFNDDEYNYQNGTLVQWHVSQDDALAPDADKSGSQNYTVAYGVYASDDQGNASFVAPIPGVGAKVPVQVAAITALMAHALPDVPYGWGTLPATLPVVMADGSINPAMPVEWDKGNAQWTTAIVDAASQGESGLPDGSHPALSIPYHITGTNLTGHFTLAGTSKEDVQARLAQAG